MTSSPRLILIGGLPASGKTTISKQLAKSMDAMRLCPDEYLINQGIDGLNSNKRKDIEQELIQKAIQTVQGGRCVILELALWKKAERIELYSKLSKQGIVVELRFLNVPIDELLARLEHRNNTKPPGAFFVDPEQLIEWAKLVEPPNEQELLIYSSQPTVCGDNRF